MSYCRKEGKDQIIFVTKDDHVKHTPENPLLPEDQVGLIKENGDINWDCPCLQGMADGQCGEPFKDAFSCFHYSEAEPKGVDCLEQFKSMQECFLSYPEIYGSLDDDIKESEATSDREGTEVESTIQVESGITHEDDKDNVKVEKESVQESQINVTESTDNIESEQPLEQEIKMVDENNDDSLDNTEMTDLAEILEETKLET